MTSLLHTIVKEIKNHATLAHHNRQLMHINCESIVSRHLPVWSQVLWVGGSNKIALIIFSNKIKILKPYK
jgi:hypothetical protein